MSSRAGRAERAGLHPEVVQGFYGRMRAVAPAAVGAIERDRADDRSRPFPATACGRLAGSLDAAGLRALGMWAHHWCLRFYDDDIEAGLRLVREIAGHPALGWTADEVRWLLGESYAAGAVVEHRFVLPVAAARELARAQQPVSADGAGAVAPTAPTPARTRSARGDATIL